MLKIFNNLIISDDLDEVMSAPEEVGSDYFFSIYCERGSFQFSKEGKSYHVEEGDLMVGQLYGMSVGTFMRTPDLKGKLICASRNLFDDALTEILHLDTTWWKKFLLLREAPVIHLTEYQNRLYQSYFNLMEIFLEDSDNPYRQRIIRLIAQSMAVEVLHEMGGLITKDKDDDKPKQGSSQKDVLFQRFITMINQKGNTVREVRSYAERLLVTPKYLSAVCKEKSGRTALDLITEVSVRNIRYYLLQTDLSVKEIAFKMDFPDVSFFCKYTRKHLGQSPLEYRRSAAL